VQQTTSPPRESGGPTDTTRGGLAGILLAGLGVTILVADLAAVATPIDPDVAKGLAIITVLAAAAAAIARPAFQAAERTRWTVSGAGVAVAALAVVLAAFGLNDTVSVAGITVGDVLWAAAYVTWYVATMLMAHRYVGGAYRSFWLDGVLTGLAAAACMTALFGDELPASGADAFVAIAQPATDLALFGLTVAVLMMIGRPGLQGALLTAGFLTLLTADVLRLSALTGGGDATVEVQMLSAVALVMPAGAAWMPPVPGRTLPIGGWWELTTPGAAMALVCGLLVIDHFDEQSAWVVGLSGAAFLIALVRMVWTLREVRSLALHRSESLTDDLTQLPNRRALFRELDVLCAPGARSGRGVAMLQIDIDGFKELNETLGHHAGDALLIAVSRRLQAVVPGTLARLGGDEFAAVVDNEHNPMRIADAISDALNDPIDIEGVSVAVGVSIGVARYPEDAHDARELARRADIAMYDAKRMGTTVAGYTAERDRHSRDKLMLLADLRRALRGDDEGLWLAYQPQVEIATGRICGAEALIRWRHPEQGEIPPNVLLPVAERGGLMRDLTLWVLEHAVSQSGQWRRAGLPMRVAVNVSAIVLVDTTLPNRIAEILQRHSLTADNLVVEVTEDAVMSDTTRAISILRRIKDLGVEIAIDDFGTGHSSLEQLKNLPADELKLDRSFVLGMDESPHDAAIVGSVVGLAKALGLRTVAEGVETEQVWRELAALGCHVAQGFGLARPMPPAQFEQWAHHPPDLARRLAPTLHAPRSAWRRQQAA